MGIAVRWHPMRNSLQTGRHGWNLFWFPATLCPCIDKRAGAPLPGCKLCKGLKWYYPRHEPSVATLRPPEENAKFMDAGMIQQGRLVMQVNAFLPNWGSVLLMKDNPVYNCGIGDRILLCTGRSRCSEVHVKGSGREQVRQAYPVPGEVGIEMCVSVRDPEGAATVRHFKPGTDVVLDGRNISFVRNSPEEGEQYSITYFHRPVYECFSELPSERRHRGRLLLKQFTLEYVDQVDAGSKYLK